MTNIEIAVISESDIPEYTKVLNLIWQGISHLYSKDAREAEQALYSETKITEFFHNPECLLIAAKLEGKIVAARYAIFEANTLFLYLTGVLNSQQRQGIGTRLHEFTFLYLRENYPSVHKVWCDTIQTNTAGIEVLKKVGFSLEGDLKNHWYGDDYYLWGYQL